MELIQIQQFESICIQVSSPGLSQGLSVVGKLTPDLMESWVSRLRLSVCPPRYTGPPGFPSVSQEKQELLDIHM
ncbi:hypothetical protein SKAU_G00216130 [Synaphobranchus kaupii]|uniref:Uncharacterized protein n=1 Tax=Synaphobranchus kaupii TaxID=118154 RepID=A0A9Q1IVF2_SYNKA|nr:hypothetical protein SKAU_G00216130 [Synaphobranchus kaupii]